MITREDIEKFSNEELSTKLQEAVDEYKITVDEVTDKDELLNKEKEIFDTQDKYNENYLSSKEYDLQEKVSFEGENYGKNEIVKKIIYFLNKLEVGWQYTLGMHQMISILKKNDIRKLPYAGYDSLLRTLNQLKFKGDSEWHDILLVNEYLSSCHEEYTKDTAFLIYLASLHNVLLDRMKIIDPSAIPNDAKPA